MDDGGYFDFDYSFATPFMEGNTIPMLPPPVGAMCPPVPTELQESQAGKIRKKKIKQETIDQGFGPPQVMPENVKSPRGRKKKVKQEKMTDCMKVRKKHDRFNGMPEEEVLQRRLPDIFAPNLDIVIVGINPGLMAAYIGHHYAGPGNHFWKCLYQAGFIPEPMNCYDDERLLEYGIGFTNIVERTTRGSGDLTRKEIKEGGEILLEKIQKYKPKIAVFNGKGIYEIFVGHKNFHIGKQPEPFPGTDTVVFAMPSSSARCAQLPRVIDKLPFYHALKKLRDHLRGDLPNMDEAEVCFPDLELKIVKREKPDVKKEKEPKIETADPPLLADIVTGESQIVRIKQEIADYEYGMMPGQMGHQFSGSMAPQGGMPGGMMPPQPQGGMSLPIGIPQPHMPLRPHMSQGSQPQMSQGQPQIPQGAQPQMSQGQPQMPQGAQPQMSQGQPQMPQGAQPQMSQGQPQMSQGQPQMSHQGQPRMPQQGGPGHMPQGNITQNSGPQQGNPAQENMSQGNMTQGNMSQGNGSQGSPHQQDVNGAQNNIAQHSKQPQDSMGQQQGNITQQQGNITQQQGSVSQQQQQGNMSRQQNNMPTSQANIPHNPQTTSPSMDQLSNNQTPSYTNLSNMNSSSFNYPSNMPTTMSQGHFQHPPSSHNAQFNPYNHSFPQNLPGGGHQQPPYYDPSAHQQRSPYFPVGTTQAPNGFPAPPSQWSHPGHNFQGQNGFYGAPQTVVKTEPGTGGFTGGCAFSQANQQN